MAANYTVAKYLGSWTPAAISFPATPNYTVSSSGTYKTVQSAVNAAIAAGGSARKYILVNPGTYTELVFIPSGPPITLYGTGDASAVKIQQKTSAPMTGTEYKALVPSANYTGSAKSWVDGCANKGSGKIGTTCSSAFIIQNVGFQGKNLTITNTYGEDNPNAGGQDQAVAVYSGADQVTLENVRMYGNQDTLWPNGTNKRFYAKNCFVEGDTDFIFGNGTAVFDNCEIRYTNARKSNGAIGAPSTESSVTYGFLFNGGSFTTTGGTNSVYFARQWPQSSLSSPVGRMIIRGANIGAHIRSVDPWKDWSSSQPVNYGSTSAPNLGEHRNTGTGAAK